MWGLESDSGVLIRGVPRSKLCGNLWAEMRREVLKVFPWQWEMAGDASAGAVQETC